MWAIGEVQMTHPVVLAPMAGVTDLPFRLIVKEFGCALVFGQLVSAKAISFGSKKTDELLVIDDAERPVGLQIFGSEPDTMAEAARYVEGFGPDIIDINMGCPAPKVVDNDDGCALMRDPVKAAKVIEAVVNAVSVPVTVKIRKGWDETSITAVEVAKHAEKAGASAITVHGRTREQFYSGKADWTIIRAVKDAVSIPVVGNGDVTTPEEAVRLMDTTKCDAVMIGRAALGNPWLFGQVIQYVNQRMYAPGPTYIEKLDMAIRHFRMAIAMKGEKSVFEMRKQLGWYLKGIPNANKVKQDIFRTEQATAVLDLLAMLRHELEQI